MIRILLSWLFMFALVVSHLEADELAPYYNKRITSESQDQRETAIAISPLSNPPDKIQLIGWMDQDAGFYKLGYGITTNGGGSWTRGLLPGLEGWVAGDVEPTTT